MAFTYRNTGSTDFGDTVASDTARPDLVATGRWVLIADDLDAAAIAAVALLDANRDNQARIDALIAAARLAREAEEAADIGRGLPDGVASLDSGGDVPADQLDNVAGGGPHAATHADGGADEVTLAESQITGLTSDLAAKATTAALGIHDSDTTNVHGIADTSALETTSGAAGKVTTHTGAVDPHGDRAFTTNAVGTHEADTTSVHGITDTSVLETTSGAASKVTTHAGAVDPHGDRAFATSAVGTHEADTTSVHGITNTALLETATGAQAKADAAQAASADRVLSNLTSASTARLNLGAEARFTTTATKTANYTAAANELVLCDTSAGSFTVTLPAASVVGQQVAVKMVAMAVGTTVTIARAGTDVINVAATSITLTLLDESVVLVSSGSGVWVVTAGRVTQSALDSRYLAGMLTTGEEIFDRRWLNTATANTGSGSLRLTYFTARKTETTTQVTFGSGTTISVSPTLFRVGLYTIDGSGGANLVASTASDTNIGAVANTRYTKSWSASYLKLAGQRYALGMLYVGGTAPTMTGSTLSGVAGQFAGDVPRSAGAMTSQTDLPSTYTDAGLTTTAAAIYAAILP